MIDVAGFLGDSSAMNAYDAWATTKGYPSKNDVKNMSKGDAEDALSDFVGDTGNTYGHGSAPAASASAAASATKSGAFDTYTAPAGTTPVDMTMLPRGLPPMLNQEEIPHVQCANERDCDKYGKEDIENELVRLGFTPTNRPNRVAGPTEFNKDSTKPELVKILLAHNKREQAKFANLQKQSRMGLRYTRGAFPSEATNPSMYDPLTGLLKTQYLTQDHHGLTAYDFKGDKWEVFYQPKLNGWGGDAIWKKTSKGGVGARGMLMGSFMLDKRGLPKVEQLNYFEHYGMGFRDKNDKLYILACKNRKNKSSYSVHPNNCSPNKNGLVAMDWVLASSHPWTSEPPVQKPEDRKFFLPDGSVVTGSQLNKLSLEEIWCMMELLESMEHDLAYSRKLKKFNLGSYTISVIPRVVIRSDNKNHEMDWIKTRMNELEAAGALESKHAYELWKKNQCEQVKKN